MTPRATCSARARRSSPAPSSHGSGRRSCAARATARAGAGPSRPLAAYDAPMPGGDRGTLDAQERALVDGIAERRDELVALACELIAYDTTSRSSPDQPARGEAALQQALAARLERHGAEIDLWEPAPEDVAGHPLSVAGIGFAGRPQLAARLRGGGGGGGHSLLLNGHIDVVPAAEADGWGHDPFDPQVRDGNVVGRGACDMKGGIAAMVLAAEVLAEH